MGDTIAERDAGDGEGALKHCQSPWTEQDLQLVLLLASRLHESVNSYLCHNNARWVFCPCIWENLDDIVHLDLYLLKLDLPLILGSPSIFPIATLVAMPPKLTEDVLIRSLLLGSPLASRRSSGPFMSLVEPQANKVIRQHLSF